HPERDALAGRGHEGLDDLLDARLHAPLLVQLTLHREHDPSRQLDRLDHAVRRAETTRPAPSSSTAWWWKLSTTTSSPSRPCRRVPRTEAMGWRGCAGAGRR